MATTKKKTPKKTAPKVSSKPIPATTRRKGKPVDESQSEEEPGEDEGEDSTEAEVSWTDNNHALTFKLLDGMTQYPEMKHGIFPPKGQNASTAKGGGKPKSHWYFLLATHIFAEDPIHKKAFEATQIQGKAGTAAKKEWIRRVKNRVSRMTKVTLDHIKTMGKTGEGIQHESDLDMTKENSLTNAWSAIKETCPWFFKMKEFIADRPNKRPVGIGNSQTEIDMEVFEGPVNNDEVDEVVDDKSEEDRSKGWHGVSEGLETIDTSEGASSVIDGEGIVDTSDSERVEGIGGGKSDEDEEDDDELPVRVGQPNNQHQLAAAKKRKVTDDQKPNHLALSLKSKPSKPAATQVKAEDTNSRPTKKAKVHEFSHLLQAEELTRQKELDLQRIKLESSTRLKIATSETAKAAIEAKIEMEKHRLAERKAKLDVQKELRLEEMRLKHQLELEKLKAFAQARHTSNSNVAGQGEGYGVLNNGAGGVGTVGGSNDIQAFGALNSSSNDFHYTLDFSTSGTGSSDTSGMGW
ncbi:hypothetical protein CVT24_004355 [Panaeolus cyanescens]|uniref:No apical meristem-associated C-terminal domain-containing protein n=1 Tax=Panaeolus cyanescens TaxID=181874 RepID=A0A409W876_9AGAR|nr:hypothetical protein CVT24_004355 [Panaeolus cyanescens]